MSYLSILFIYWIVSGVNPLPFPLLLYSVSSKRCATYLPSFFGIRILRPFLKQTLSPTCFCTTIRSIVCSSNVRSQAVCLGSPSNILFIKSSLTYRIHSLDRMTLIFSRKVKKSGNRNLSSDLSDSRKFLIFYTFSLFYSLTFDINTTVSQCVEAVKQIPERQTSALVELSILL